MALRRVAKVVAACGLVGVLLDGCSPSPGPPTDLAGTSRPTPSMLAGTSAPTSSTLAGETSLVVAGRITDPCIPPPEGCAYWATLVVSGGDTLRAELVFAANHAALIAGPGLPSSLPPGRYGVIFEVAVVSDVVSPIPLPGGTTGPEPPQPETACTTVVDVSDAPSVSVLATFHGIECEASVTAGTRP